MLNKAFLFIISLFILSCASNKTEKNDFNDYILHESLVIHTLKENMSNNEVNIFDKKNNLNLNGKPLNVNNTVIKATTENKFADYILVEYILNKDLAFIAFLKKGQNKVYCFLFNKGKYKGKWLLVEKFERLNV
jgi:uncharacterized membrane protein